MIARKYRRIYHYHLKKCGGSTVNQWLDTLTADERIFNDRAWKGLWTVRAGPDGARKKMETVLPSLARAIFHWSDVVHGHGPLRMYAPENTFCFTILRDPVQRLVSQVWDFRRLSDSDTANSPPEVRKCAADSRRLPLQDFLEINSQRDGIWFLDNYLTRALAAGRIGDGAAKLIDPDALREVAMQSLEKDYDLVGMTDNLDLVRNALCAMIELPPAQGIPTINVGRVAGQSDPELANAHDILEHLTRADRVLYDRVRKLFDQRHRQTAQAFDSAAFEASHACSLLDQARGFFHEGTTRYSVRAPINGSGFHGRDGSGTPSCAVWSGPDTRTTLYIPTPPDMRLSLLIWIRGYADVSQRNQLRVRVDGTPVDHRFKPMDGYADLLEADICPTRSFVRMEIDVDETLTTGVPGSNAHDQRKRGFAFDSYGWRPIT